MIFTKQLPRWVGEESGSLVQCNSVEQFLTKHKKADLFSNKEERARRKIIGHHYNEIQHYGYTSIPANQSVEGRHLFYKP